MNYFFSYFAPFPGLINALICAIPWIVSGVYLLNAQDEYLKLYKNIKNPEFPVIDTSQEAIFEKPLENISAFPYMPIVLIKAILGKYNSPILIQATKRLRKWFIINSLMLVFLLVYFIFFMR